MELAVSDTFGQAAQPFVDGFGERRVIYDNRGKQFDVLKLDKTLTQVPSFESALRERVNRISAFHHDSFSRVRGLEVEKGSGAFLVVSDHVRGVRLSTLLAAAEKRSVPVDLPVATCLIRQLVWAVSVWREQLPDTFHGAIGPDRIVVTPDGRLVVVESVLGSALEQLRYPRQRYWEELAVPLPGTFTISINARADVLQVGTVALALLLGRRLTASDRVDEIQPALADRLPSATRLWLARALQLETVGSFTSVLEARAGLDQAFGEPDLVEEQDSLLLFMARCLALTVDTPTSEEEAVGVDDIMPGGDDLPDVDLATRIEALRTFLANRSSRSTLVEPQAEDPSPPLPDPAEEFSPEESHAVAPAPLPRVAEKPKQSSPFADLGALLPQDLTRRLWLAAAVTVAIGIALAVMFFGRFPSSPEPMGRLAIDTRPPGIAVSIDGTPRGVTPLSLDLSAGEHVVELTTDTQQRKIPVTIRAGSDMSQFLEMGVPAAPASASELRVRTEPLGAAVTVDGQYVGRSPVSVGDLAPGPHTVVVKHETGTATEQVLIEAGKAASLFVPLVSRTAPPAGAAAGWITVNAPVDVQLFENGRFLGSSRIDRIMLPTGRHELDIINDALGYQERRVVQVTAGQVSPIRLDWPTGRLSLNAVPWAQAFVDGMPVGETPIANMQIPIGPHEVLFRHPQLGERRITVTVTARETAKGSVDFRSN